MLEETATAFPSVDELPAESVYASAHSIGPRDVCIIISLLTPFEWRVTFLSGLSLRLKGNVIFDRNLSKRATFEGLKA